MASVALSLILFLGAELSYVPHGLEFAFCASLEHRPLEGGSWALTALYPLHTRAVWLRHTPSAHGGGRQERRGTIICWDCCFFFGKQTLFEKYVHKALCV